MTQRVTPVELLSFQHPIISQVRKGTFDEREGEREEGRPASGALLRCPPVMSPEDTEGCRAGKARRPMRDAEATQEVPQGCLRQGCTLHTSGGRGGYVAGTPECAVCLVPPRGCDERGGQGVRTSRDILCCGRDSTCKSFAGRGRPPAVPSLVPFSVPVPLWGHVATWLGLSGSCVSLSANRVRCAGVFPC